MSYRLFLISTIILSFLWSFAQVRVPIQSVHEVKNNTTDISAVAKINDFYKKEEVALKGTRIGAKIGNLITIQTSIDNWADLAHYKGFDYLQIAENISPQLSRTIPDLRADRVYSGEGLNQKYTGKDVIIGVTDWGFDYTHPMFYDTALQHTRILAAWDQFKKSGPAPQGFSYGTEYEGEAELLTAQSDTFNIYQYATHGTHVAGIAGGSGAGTENRGVAYEANFLFTTFLVNEAAVIDAFSWMKNKADAAGKRLVINMSWGLYNLGTIDGTSILSTVINQLSAEGVVFVTSGGNNGDVNFHIKKTFANDTLKTKIDFYPYGAHAEMWGQNITIWGEKNMNFGASFCVYNASNQLVEESPHFNSLNGASYEESFILIDSDTVFFKAIIEKEHPLNGKPLVRLIIKNTNTSYKIGLKAFGNAGTIHCYNVVELKNDVGNWGLPFTKLFADWTAGDNLYGLGEPASTESCITVAAHLAEIVLSNGQLAGGTHAQFSSIGPTIDERQKPDVSAPGVGVISSISSFTTNSYTLHENVSFNGKDYPFARFSGTSMSAPATTGVVALMLQANPFIATAADIKNILIKTARTDDKTGDIPDGGSTIWGFGKVNAMSAVQLAEKQLGLYDSYQRVIYPNPCHSVVMYADEKINYKEIYDCEIYSFNGNMLLKSTIGSPQNPLDVSALVNGLYIIKIYASNYIFIAKLLVAKE